MLRFLTKSLKFLFDLFRPGLPLTTHARQRMRERGISSKDIRLAIAHGARSVDGNAISYIIGRRELKQKEEDLIGCLGIKVVVAKDSGSIITVVRKESIAGFSR